jgi:hypothetical protein
MNVTISNNRFIIGSFIIYITARLLMIFVPFTMVVSTSYYPEKHFNFSYFTFAVHFIVEAVYCVIFLYIIALLKFISAKKFVLVSFFILLVVQMIFFLAQILMLFWHTSFTFFSIFYGVLELMYVLSLAYLVIATFWIKNHLLSIPYRIYGFSLVLLHIGQLLYFRLAPIPRFPFLKHNPYEYLIGLIGITPDAILLIILFRSDRLFNQSEPDISIIIN